MSNSRPFPPGPIEVGLVGRAHGLDGSFYVRRPVANLLVKGGTVEIDGKSYRTVRRSGTDAQPIIRLEGLDRREAAEALLGKKVFVQQSEAPKLGEGEYWAHDLEGCSVHDGAVIVGTVERMMPLPSCEVLVVRRAEGDKELLVPLVRDAVRSVDIEAKRIDVDLKFLGESSED